jgi:K+-sensing histidine kinase KdpD
LGLAIAQAVAHAHHGTMTIKRETEGGLRIEVRLPLAASSEATDTLPVPDANDAGGNVAAAIDR